jgi:molecular chaperone GrpE (heat shock protein)
MVTEQTIDIPDAEILAEPQAEPVVEDEGGEPQAEETQDRAQQLESEVAELRQQLDREKKSRRDEYIQNRTAREKDQRMDRMESLIVDLVERYDKGELATDTIKETVRDGVSRIENEITDTGQAQVLSDEINEISTRHDSEIKDSNNNLDRSSVDMQNFARRWKEAEELWAKGRYADARERVAHAETSLELAKARASGPSVKAANPAEMDLNANRGQRTGSGRSDAAKVTAYGRGEIPWSADVQEAMKRQGLV